MPRRPTAGSLRRAVDQGPADWHRAHPNDLRKWVEQARKAVRSVITDSTYGLPRRFRIRRSIRRPQFSFSAPPPSPCRSYPRRPRRSPGVSLRHYGASATKKRPLPTTIKGLGISLRVPADLANPSYLLHDRSRHPVLNARRCILTFPFNLYIYAYILKRRATLAHVRLTEFRQNIATHFDNVIASRAPLLVTRQGSEALVLVAEGEYESMQETLHLLSTPANSDRLRESIAQLRRGELIEKDPTL